MKKLKVDLKQDAYEIVIDYNIIDQIGAYLKSAYNQKQVFIITDQTVNRIYGARVKASLGEFTIHEIVVEPTEATKTFKVYIEVITELLAKGITRDCLILAVGGGVVTDFAGFVASTLHRGVNYVSVPTTVLSQIDACIGGKTALNFRGQKNVVGTFHQPKLVLIDPTTLQTLDKPNYSSGIAEIIKHAVIGSDKLLSMLQNTITVTSDMIYESLMVKKKFVEKDVNDKGDRMYLNFGHTFGHVIESERKVKHGVAVGLGMLMEARLGMDLGFTKSNVYENIRSLLQKFGLDASYIDYKQYMGKITADKKNLSGTLNIILLKDIGKPIIHKMPLGFNR